MNTLHRFSSRRQRLDHAFLSEKLRGAKSYRRIAGYFRSSIFELVGEQIADIPTVQVVHPGSWLDPIQRAADRLFVRLVVCVLRVFGVVAGGANGYNVAQCLDVVPAGGEGRSGDGADGDASDAETGTDQRL